MATLLVANPEGEPRRYDVPETGVDIGIGRKSDNGIAIADPHLSSYHANIRFDKTSETFILKDLGSHNGTRVNGATLENDQELGLKETDAIKFGILEVTLLLARPVRSLVPKPLKRPEIVAPASVIPIIDVETLKAATRKPPTTRNSDSPETVVVVDVCRALIKRLDLIDDLLDRYRDVKKDAEVITDLEVLKQSFQDMLGGYRVEPYPETGKESLQNSVVIPKNTPLPCSISEIYATSEDNETSIEVDITQGEDDDPRYVDIIGRITLNVPEGRPAGCKVKVSYSYDENQRVHVRVTDEESGISKEIQIEYKVEGVLSEEEVERQAAYLKKLRIE